MSEVCAVRRIGRRAGDATDYRPLRVFEARRRRGRDEVLVSWRGFRRNEAVWVPRADIAGTEALRRWDAASPAR